MQLTPHLARAADLVKVIEPFEPDAVRRPRGEWAIGYGHTLTAREGAKVSRSDGGALLIYDLIQASTLVEREVQVPLNDDQRAALIAFAFSIGEDAFARDAVVARVNAGDLHGAAQALARGGRADLASAFQGAETPVQRANADVLGTVVTPTTKPAAATKARFSLAWSWRNIAVTGLGSLGFLLFGFAVAMILSGRLGAVNLAVGLVGVLLMVPATYVLLGRRRRT